MSSGCGCKEVLLYLLFLQQHPYFLFIKKNVFCSLLRTLGNMYQITGNFRHRKIQPNSNLIYYGNNSPDIP